MLTSRFSRKSARFVLFVAMLLIVFSLVGSIMADDDEQTVPVQQLPDESVVKHAYSTLERDGDEVELEIETRKLKSKHVYTVWWVVFNNPGACSAPGCGLDDGFLPDGSPNFAQRAATEMSALWATGGIVPPNGKASFQATLEENVAPGAVNFGPGLTDAGAAEFHIVIRDHGPDDQDLLEEQMTTFGGGCNNAPPWMGTPGTYECVDDQLAIHVPGEGDDD